MGRQADFLPADHVRCQNGHVQGVKAQRVSELDRRAKSAKGALFTQTEHSSVKRNL